MRKIKRLKIKINDDVWEGSKHKCFDDLPDILLKKNIKYLFEDKTYSEVMKE
ncbi:hypothetical protein [Lysinibacillus fusiformis]|uniref:hypothetical protein n=1 Tax=Lysinibacillus fusiformis TaxID=28031 RepID=UPI001E43BE41|nr:hypothetical protein [Lysinibacillus fusiformis]